jgi:hypothetical protein
MLRGQWWIHSDADQERRQGRERAYEEHEGRWKIVSLSYTDIE